MTSSRRRNRSTLPAPAEASEGSAETTRQRLDKWLYFARLAKSRGVAQKMTAAGHVRLNGQKIREPDKPLRRGDVLTLSAHQNVRVLRIEGFAERRGPYNEARLLYEDLGEQVAGQDDQAG